MKLRQLFFLAVLSVSLFVLFVTQMNSAQVDTFYHFWRTKVIDGTREKVSGSDSPEIATLERASDIAREHATSDLRNNNGFHLKGKENESHVENNGVSRSNASNTVNEIKATSVSHSAPSSMTTAPQKQTTWYAVSTTTTTTTTAGPATRGAATRGQATTSTEAWGVSDDLRHDVRGWQVVTASSLQVYSAFYDDVERRTVRVLALGGQKEFLKGRGVWCHLWDSVTSPAPRAVNGTAKAFAWKPFSFSGVYVLCPLAGDSRPYAVSITMEKADRIQNWIPIKYPNGKRMLSVCFPVVNGGYSNAAEMVQTIEMDRILGVEKFFIYEQSPRREIKAIMNYYEKKGLLEVLPFTFSIRGGIHYFGQNIAINDCVFRNLHESEFVAVKDLDEIIVPANFTTLIDLLEDIKSRKIFKQVCSIVARNSFFWKSHPDDVDGSTLGPEAQRLRVQTLTKIWRQKEIHPSGKRSKQLVIPDRVLLVGVHWTEVPRPGYHGMTLDPTEATSHHFHNTWSKELLLPQNLRRDDSARLRHGVALLHAVRRVYDDMQMECKCERPW